MELKRQPPPPNALCPLGEKKIFKKKKNEVVLISH
jgi:hypothetical protein